MGLSNKMGIFPEIAILFNGNTNDTPVCFRQHLFSIKAMYVCMYVRTYVCMYVRTYVCMYNVYIYIYVIIPSLVIEKSQTNGIKNIY